MTYKSGKSARKAVQPGKTPGGKGKPARAAPAAEAARAHSAWVRSGAPERVSKSLEARGITPAATSIINESKRRVAAAAAKRSAGRKSARRKTPRT